MAVDEEHEGLQADGHVDELHALIFGVLSLLRGRRGAKEDVRRPVHDGLVAPDRVPVLHPAVGREVLPVIVVVGEGAALVGDGALRIDVVDHRGVHRHQGRCPIQHGQVPVEMKIGVDLGQVGAFFEGQIPSHVHHLGQMIQVLIFYFAAALG